MLTFQHIRHICKREIAGLLPSYDKDELDSVTVSQPNKALAEDVLAALVYGIIPGESLA